MELGQPAGRCGAAAGGDRILEKGEGALTAAIKGCLLHAGAGCGRNDAKSKE